jgi:hypothetical protein
MMRLAEVYNPHPMADRAPKILAGTRVLILAEPHAGEEGVCLGPADADGSWFVSPESSNEVLRLEFERDFGLLIERPPHPLNH